MGKWKGRKECRKGDRGERRTVREENGEEKERIGRRRNEMGGQKMRDKEMSKGEAEEMKGEKRKEERTSVGKDSRK